MTTRECADANDGENVSSRRVAVMPALRTAAPARKTYSFRPIQYTTRYPIAEIESSQRARVTQSSQRARDVWAPRARRQAPVSRQDATGGIAISPAITSRPAHWGRRLAPARPLPLDGFERLIADIGFNVLDLEELVGVASGRITKTSFSHGPSNVKVLIPQSGSYFAHVPARYGNGTCLDDALRCITTRVKRVLAPGFDTGTLAEGELYGRALRSLQSAINSNTWAHPNVLCAAEIISIYELLEGPSGSTAWEQHLAGSSRLIRARGPSGFKTEFEKSLLISMISTLVGDAMTLQQGCFLDEPAWQSLLHSLSLPTSGLPLRTRTYVRLGSMGARASRLMNDVHEATANRQAFLDKELKELESRCRSLKMEAASWRREYDAYRGCLETPDGTFVARGDVGTEVLCAACSLQAGICRLVGAMSREDRIAEEWEALVHSEEKLKLLRDATVDTSGTAGFYVDQKGVIAKSILGTTNVWLTGCRAGVDDGGHSRVEIISRHERLIDGNIYAAWRNWKPTEKT
ncbi:hypothetical protein SUNI508_04090 [Seiridium unicorne]|uniref:Uncharacterized protein n=1 Tax=Seiridium unicorne TaxID=138068 RepID=A0ABR2V9T0_9PEZI